MDPRIREIGIPVRSVNWVRLFAGADRRGRPCLYSVMGQESAPLFILQIDPRTGECRQFMAAVQKANFPTAALMSRSGVLYIGAAYAGHLLRFDPAEELLEDLGPIHPGAATFPCRLDEDAQGRIWIGSYGSADLSCYDPAGAIFVRYGRMDEIDMYNYPLVNRDGTIACLIRVTRSRVVVFDPPSGEKHGVGPVVTQGEGSLDLFRGSDGRLYIRSSAGDFRLEGSAVIPVGAVPEPAPAPTLPGGSTFCFADAGEQSYRILSIRRPDASEMRFELEYEAGGSRLFYLHAGPDQCLYGSSILPLHFFRHNPKDGELTNLGRCSSATGEAYSMTNCEDRVYIASYPGAVLSVYDPRRAYRFGEDPDANPRDLGRIDELSYRPRSCLAGPLGRVWTASVPDYGRWGGPLSWYDPRRGEKGAYYRICGDASCYALAWLRRPELIAVGTTIEGGSGTRPKVDQAVLFLWDYQREEKLWEGTLERPIHTFNALLAHGDLLYGTALGEGGAVLFAFDPAAHRFVHCLQMSPGQPLDLGLQRGPDGRIYGFTSGCLYRLDPAGLAVEEIMRAEDLFHVAGPIMGEEAYFAHNHRLMAARLF